MMVFAIIWKIVINALTFITIQTWYYIKFILKLIIRIIFKIVEGVKKYANKRKSKV